MIVKATAGAMGGSRSEEFLATAENGEDTYVRCTSLRLRRQRRGGQVRPPAVVAYDDAPAAHVEHTPDTPTIDTLVAHLNERVPPRATAPWTAGDTLKNVIVVLRHPDGTREPLAIGLPGDREVDEKRLAGQLDPTEVEAFTEADFAAPPRAGQGLHRPGRRWARRTPRASATWSTRASSRAPAGSPAPTSRAGTSLDLVAGRDFTADGMIEAAEVRDGDPCPNCDGGRWRRPAASRWATSSSSAASTPRRST